MLWLLLKINDNGEIHYERVLIDPLLEIVVPTSDKERCITSLGQDTSSESKLKNDYIISNHNKRQKTMQSPQVNINSYTNEPENAFSKPTKPTPHIASEKAIKSPLSILPSAFSTADNNSANAPREEVVEEPFIKKYYYKLGPHDPPLPSAQTIYGKAVFLFILTPII